MHMNTPSYEVGRLAALTVRLALSSGLSPDDARAALSLARTMMDDDMAGDGRADQPIYGPPRGTVRGSDTMSRARR
jgi:L-asparaginase II